MIFYTIVQFAEFKDTSRQTIYTAIKAGKLNYRRKGKKILIPLTDKNFIFKPRKQLRK